MSWQSAEFDLGYIQWISVSTYPQGIEKEYVLNKVRFTQSPIYPKYDARHKESER